MQPRLNIRADDMVRQIIAEGIELLMDPGVRIHNKEGLALLGDSGATVNLETQVARIPDSLVQRALETRPSEFYLFDLDGEPVVHYGDDSVQFDPGSAAVAILDSETQEQRPPTWRMTSPRRRKSAACRT